MCVRASVFALTFHSGTEPPAEDVEGCLKKEIKEVVFHYL